MVNRSEPNAQNSELNRQTHPSGARIEKLMNEKGQYGETLRPSEREDSYVPTQDMAEGERETHRKTPSTRET